MRNDTWTEMFGAANLGASDQRPQTPFLMAPPRVAENADLARDDQIAVYLQL